MPLTEREQRFIEEYTVNPNTVRAYLSAYPGSTYRTALREGYKLKKNPEIKEELAARRAVVEKTSRVKAVTVIRGLANVACSDPIDLFQEMPDGSIRFRSIRDVPVGLRKAIAGIKVRRVSREVEEEVLDGKVTTTTIEEDVIEVRFNDRVQALDKLMKMLGLYEKDNRQKADIDAAKARLREIGFNLDVLMGAGKNGN